MQSHSVVQKYLVSPLLYKGLKFDFRIYVLVTGCDPLRVYIYNEGLVRFATEKYEPPDDNNIDNLCMHLTNYAINKENPKYVFNTSLENLSHGHKKSLAEFFQTLKNFDLPAHDYWSQIKDQIVKTLIAGQSHLMHEYRMAQPHNFANDMCFQILGFDFMIDAKNKCYLLEVNHTPSFTAETPLDELVKANLIRDTLVLVKITSHARANAIARAELEQNRRIFTGKSLKVTPEERQKIMAMFQAERDNFERSHLGSFERIFPSKNPMRQATYEEMLAFSL